jgi:alpha-tubulin suppressor-like RCC1 family protein
MKIMKTIQKILSLLFIFTLFNCSNDDNGSSNGSNELYRFIDSNSETSYAIRNDGTLWVWGANNFGQYGNGTTDFYTDRRPRQVGTDNDWESVSAGNGYVMAIKTNGTLWSWGWGVYGALGHGNMTSLRNPTQVGTSTDWKTVYSGNNVTYAIKDNNTLWSTGRGGFLGDGTTTDRSTFVQVPGSYSTARGGYFCNYAISTTTVLYGCGASALGLGLPNTTAIHNTLTVLGNATLDWAKITSSDSCAWGLKANSGNVYTFGKYNFGAGEVNNLGQVVYNPINNVKEISASTYGQFVLFIKNDGTLWAVGKNNYGQLGDGTTTDRTTPIQIGTDTNWENVVAGYDSGIARKSNGEVYVWGLNGEGGNLGLGDTANKLSPTRL